MDGHGDGNGRGGDAHAVGLRLGRGKQGGRDEATFTAAGLLPLTGFMAYLGPANIATMKLAQNDINAAGGVLGKDIDIVSADTSDATTRTRTRRRRSRCSPGSRRSWSGRRRARW